MAWRTAGMRVTHEFCTRFVGQLILGRQPSLVYYVDPWGLSLVSGEIFEFQGRSLCLFAYFPAGCHVDFAWCSSLFCTATIWPSQMFLSEQDIQKRPSMPRAVTFAQEPGHVYTPLYVVGFLIPGGVQGRTSQLRGGRGARRGLDGRAASARFVERAPTAVHARVTGNGPGAAGRATGHRCEETAPSAWLWRDGTCIWWTGRHSVRRIHWPIKPPGPNPPAKSKAWASR